MPEAKDYHREERFHRALTKLEQDGHLVDTARSAVEAGADAVASLHAALFIRMMRGCVFPAEILDLVGDDDRVRALAKWHSGECHRFAYNTARDGGPMPHVLRRWLYPARYGDVAVETPSSTPMVTPRLARLMLRIVREDEGLSAQ